MRFLFVTWEGGGNLPPALAIAERLRANGHEVRFLGHRAQRGAVERAGLGFTAYHRAPDNDSSRPEAAQLKDWEIKSPPRLLAALRDVLFFGPAALFAEEVLDELGRRPADAIAVDWMLFGAIAAAEKSGIPTAVLWHSPYSLPTLDVPSFGPGFGLPKGHAGRLRDKTIRRISKGWWEKGLPVLNAARDGIGLTPLSSVFDQFDRAARVLVLGSPAFDFAGLNGAELPLNVRYVGPQCQVGIEPSETAISADDRPLVLVSLSTTYQAQAPVLRRIVGALGTLPVRALVTTGPAISLDGAPPPNVELRQWTDHAEVLPGAWLVVTHGGMGTTMASLAHGVPVVCVPMGRDQNDVAARVVHAGAGCRVSAKAGEAKLAAAFRAALADRSLTANAARLGAAIRGEIAADRAVAEMEALGEPVWAI